MVSIVQSCGQTLYSAVELVTWPFIEVAKAIARFVKAIFQSIAIYFLMISVFRTHALTDPFSRWVIEPISRFILNVYLWLHGKVPNAEAIDPERLKKSQEFLSQFGEVRSCTTQDDIELSWMLFKAEDFDEWVKEQGGIRDGEWIRPQNPEDWETLKALDAFKWFEKEGEAFKVPQKCDAAEGKCIFRVLGFGREIPMDKAFIGLHLALGFDYAVFNWREKLTIKDAFEDAETAYQALIGEGIDPQKVTVLGNCRSNFVVARLLEDHHEEGLHAAMIHPPPSLRSMIEKQSWPSNRLGLLGLERIEEGNNHFDTIKRLETLPEGDNPQLCVILCEGDETLPEDTIEQFRQAAPCKLILEPKKEDGLDPHLSEPLRNPEILAPYVAFLSRIPYTNDP